MAPFLALTGMKNFDMGI